MFSKSAFGILKQKALQGLQNKIEHVGFHSNRLENSVLKSDDPRVTQLTRELQMVIDALKSISKSSMLFHNSIKPITDANATVEEAFVKLGLAEDIPFRTNAHDMVNATSTETLLKELQQQVVEPIEKTLSYLADLKARVMERGILELELRHCEEGMNKLKTKAPGSTKLSEAEDRHARKMVVYHQFNANLMDALDNLRAERYNMVHKALLALQNCQQRFFAGAAVSMQTLCDVQFDLPSAELPEPIIEIIEDNDNNKDNNNNNNNHNNNNKDAKHMSEITKEDEEIDDTFEQKSAGGMAVSGTENDFADLNDNNDVQSDEEGLPASAINETDVSLVNVKSSAPEIPIEHITNDATDEKEQLCDDVVPNNTHNHQEELLVCVSEIDNARANTTSDNDELVVCEDVVVTNNSDDAKPIMCGDTSAIDKFEDESKPIVCQDETKTYETNEAVVEVGSVKVESNEAMGYTVMNALNSSKQILPPPSNMLTPTPSAAVSVPVTSTVDDNDEELIVQKVEKSHTFAEAFDQAMGAGVEEKEEVVQQLQDSVDAIWEKQVSKLAENNEENYNDDAEEVEDDEELLEISHEELVELI